MNAVTSNQALQVYVIPCDGGYTYVGFDTVLDLGNRLAVWLRENGERAEDIDVPLRGTLDAHRRYESLRKQAAALSARLRRRCTSALTEQLVGLESRYVEVVDCYGLRRRFWVKRSGGWLPKHRELPSVGSRSGCAVTGAPYQAVKILA
jgi:hypothetical protein